MTKSNFYLLTIFFNLNLIIVLFLIFPDLFNFHIVNIGSSSETVKMVESLIDPKTKESKLITTEAPDSSWDLTDYFLVLGVASSCISSILLILITMSGR